MVYTVCSAQISVYAIWPDLSIPKLAVIDQKKEMATAV